MNGDTRHEARDWRLVAGLLAPVLLLVGAEFWLRGAGEEGLRLALRTTARTSAVLFALAYSAEGVPWLRRNGDSLLLAFAGSQSVHLVAVLALTAVRQRPSMLADPPGIIAYLCVALALAPALAGRQRFPAWYRRVEEVALFVFWGIMTGAFAHFFPGIQRTGLHYAVAALLVVSLAAHLYGLVRRRAVTVHTAAAEP